MSSSIVVTDFDGVIGDSLPLALEITRNIVDLFDKTAKINSFADYYRLLGKRSELVNITETESNALRELYRIMYRHRANEIALFPKVLEVYSCLTEKPLLVTSSYADAVRTALKEDQKCFQAVYGYESGHKKDILLQLKSKYDLIYVTDSSRDVAICKEIGVPVIATCWGYDPIENLKKKEPDYLITDLKELSALLVKCGYCK